ncbi:MAG: hypothetical protein ACI88G_002092 [Woeseiaceae bacterium]
MVSPKECIAMTIEQEFTATSLTIVKSCKNNVLMSFILVISMPAAKHGFADELQDRNENAVDLRLSGEFVAAQS